MKTVVVQATCAAAVFCALSVATIGIHAAHNQQRKKAPASHPNPSSGAELYRKYCAVCHANDGKGNGPAPAPSKFKEPPPDLTTLAQRMVENFRNATFPICSATA